MKLVPFIALIVLSIHELGIWKGILLISVVWCIMPWSPETYLPRK